MTAYAQDTVTVPDPSRGHVSTEWAIATTATDAHLSCSN
jgi:hypothetical protein